MNFQSKEFIYFLGFMWADGYIRYYRTKNGIDNYKISLEINSEDALAILPIMESIHTWAVHKRKRRESWKETWTFSKNSKEFYKFLEKYYYVEKSTKEPTRLLKLIPEELKVYFWKGLIDGDGSVGLSGRGAYFEVASTYNYKYKELKKWLSSLGVSGSIYQQISKRGHKSSVYKLYGKKVLAIERVLPLYGLTRKNIKFNQIKEKYV